MAAAIKATPHVGAGGRLWLGRCIGRDSRRRSQLRLSGESTARANELARPFLARSLVRAVVVEVLAATDSLRGRFRDTFIGRKRALTREIPDGGRNKRMKSLTLVIVLGLVATFLAVKSANAEQIALECVVSRVATGQLQYLIVYIGDDGVYVHDKAYKDPDYKDTYNNDILDSFYHKTEFEITFGFRELKTRIDRQTGRFRELVGATITATGQCERLKTPPNKF